MLELPMSDFMRSYYQEKGIKFTDSERAELSPQGREGKSYLRSPDKDCGIRGCTGGYRDRNDAAGG